MVKENRLFTDIQDLEVIPPKSVIKEMFELAIVSEYNKNHDAKGRFASSGGGGKVLDNSMTTKQFDSYSKTYGGRTSKADQELINEYQNSEARPINFNLKESQGKLDKQSMAIGTGNPKNTTPYYIDTYGGKRAKIVERLDANMKHKLKTKAVLYRGVSIDADLKPGDTLKNYGFVSTSFSKDLAATFTFNGIRYRSDTTKDYVLRIVAPKGTKGLMPHTLTGARTIEQEFILPRNTDLKIKKVVGKGNTPGGGAYTPSYNYIVLEVTI